MAPTMWCFAGNIRSEKLQCLTNTHFVQSEIRKYVSAEGARFVDTIRCPFCLGASLSAAMPWFGVASTKDAGIKSRRT
jgi:hypothetical protein